MKGKYYLLDLFWKAKSLYFFIKFNNHNKMNKRNNYLDSLLEILEKEYLKTEITKNIYFINLKKMIIMEI